MSTTLPLFWHLSSASKKERIDASVKLISALEQFQAEFAPKVPSESSEEEEDDEPENNGEREKSHSLDSLNAQDVSYSIRRLVRGLASPRESSRLGFAVALTELLLRTESVTCSQIVALILDSAKIQGSMTGQEERDVLFARLFGLTSVIRSGLLVREKPISPSVSSAPATSNAASFHEVLAELVILGEKKSWLRESAWWTILLAVDVLGKSQVSWKGDAFDGVLKSVYTDNKVWSPEKVALTMKLQKLLPKLDWRKYLSPTFKYPDLLVTANFTTLARILKDLDMDDSEEPDVSKAKAGHWKPQVHFVWDLLIGEVLSSSNPAKPGKSSFPEFFRILVDESLFSSTSSPERKYWGFQIFQKALPQVQTPDMPMLFTKNFMRSWINHLSNSDRYLHKAAKQVANDIQNLVKNNPTLGFTLILQLTGVHGSQQFDKLTKTKTVETILASMDKEGIERYIEYLLEQVNESSETTIAEIQTVNARRGWIIDQFAALIRNGAIPKDDSWVHAILDWFVVHGLFTVKKKAEKSKYLALRAPPAPVFSDDLRKSCREKLLSCLAELTNQSTVVRADDKTLKVVAVASDGEFWVSKVLSTIEHLEKDEKHVNTLSTSDEEVNTLRQKARELIVRLGQTSGERWETAKGAQLLVCATLLRHYCVEDDEDDLETLQGCIDAASRMFPVQGKKGKNSRESTDAGKEEVPEPVDVLVDTVIGFLDQATAYTRAVANQVFTLLSGSVQQSTIDLILAQLERRNPSELVEDEDEDGEMEGEGDDEDDEDDEEGEEDVDEPSENEEDEEEEEGDLDEEADAELRRKIEEALRVNGIEAATGETDTEEEQLMDDDQMIAIDEQLAAAFRARADEKKLGKGVDAQREAMHFKNRILDLLDTFISKQQTSPFIPSLILPLISLIVNSGIDERQLSDKAAGIIRSRIGKLREVPLTVDKEQLTQILDEIHTRARKAPGGDILATLEQASLYVCRALLSIKEEGEKVALQVYRESLVDFATRKASRLNGSFLQSFFRRFPAAAWGLREDLLNTEEKAVNAYRLSQVYQLLNTLVTQLQGIGERAPEVLSYIPKFRTTIQATIHAACSSSTSTAAASLSPAQIKDLFKLVLHTIRQTRRFFPNGLDRFREEWMADSWTTLGETLERSDKFGKMSGMCRQVVKLLKSEDKAKKKAIVKDEVSHQGDEKGATSVKRKADAVEDEDRDDVEGGDEEGGVAKKTKRKKVKKVKTKN